MRNRVWPRFQHRASKHQSILRVISLRHILNDRGVCTDRDVGCARAAGNIESNVPFCCTNEFQQDPDWVCWASPGRCSLSASGPSSGSAVSAAPPCAGGPAPRGPRVPCARCTWTWCPRRRSSRRSSPVRPKPAAACRIYNYWVISHGAVGAGPWGENRFFKQSIWGFQL